MQLFIDNWQTVILGAIGSEATSLEVSPALAAALSAATYENGSFFELTLGAGSSPAGLEVVRVVEVALGVLTIERGSGALAWPEGSEISARLTAAAVKRIQDGTIVLSDGGSQPTEIPPSQGALFIARNIFMAVGIESVSDWVKIYGSYKETLNLAPGAAAASWPVSNSYNRVEYNPDALSYIPMPAQTLLMPAWTGNPQDFEVAIKKADDGHEVTIVLDFTACTSPNYPVVYDFNAGGTGVTATKDISQQLVTIKTKRPAIVTLKEIYISAAFGDFFGGYILIGVVDDHQRL
jgi:hypothetical protein